jgi:hypothetical protein
MINAQTKLTDKALALAAAGAKVYPSKLDKAPVTPNGFYDGTTDQTKIRQMFARPAAAHAGIHVEGDYLIIDLDVDKVTKEKSGEQQFDNWEHCEAAKAAAVVVDTPSGGKHLWYKAHPAITERFQKGEFRPKIDVLAAGGVNFYGPDPSVLSKVQECPVADELMDAISAHKNAIEIAQASARVDDWDTDDSTDDIIWKVTQVLTTQPNDIEHRDDVVRALHGLKASLGEQWDELTPLVHSWLQQDPRNDERWCRDHWERLKPNGSATAGTFFQIACLNQGRRVPMMPVPEGPLVSTAGLADWYYLEGEHKVRNAADGRLLDTPAFNTTHGPMAVASVVQEGRVVYQAKYRPDLHRGNGNPVVTDEGGVRYLNTYQPLGYIANPAHLETAEWQTVETHFFKLLANDTEANHVLDWCAYVTQNPGRKVAWAPLVIGIQGTGKSTLLAITRAAVGPANTVAINKDALKDSFNSFAFENCLVGIEEVKIGWGKYDIMDALKELITSPEVSQRQMRKERTKGTNVSNYMLFSNHDDALALTEGDRRYMVCRGKHEHRDELLADGMSDAYFEELHRVIREQPEVIYSGLMLRDVPEFNPHARAPVTDALREMANASMPKDAADLKETIEELAYDDWLNPEIIPVCRVTERQKDKTGYALQTQALKKAFEHLGYCRWQPLDGKGRQKVGSTATNLYVKRKYVNYQWQKLKALMPKK